MRGTLRHFGKGALFCAALFAALFATMQAGRLRAQQSPQPPPPGQYLAPNQLDDLTAPIALYPDPLLSQILVASTYPLELVQVSQWLQRNPGLSGAAVTQAAQQQNWDPSVQALAVFPDLVKRLNQDITWTTDLGNAFLNQQGDVMDAVQRMRLKAQRAGRLASTAQQTVTVQDGSGTTVIEIEPANPQVIYVPEYDPGSIWGPPLYYPYASWYYPRFGAGAYFGWGPGIPIGVYFGGGWGGWGGWGWHPGWGDHRIVVNNNFIHRYNFNAGRAGALSGNSNWAHDGSHRQGVPYPTAGLSNRFGAGPRQNLQTRPGAGQQQNRPPQPQAANPQRNVSPQPGTQRMGNRQIAPSAPAANRSAFGGVREGGAANSHSDHGFSSLGAARSGGSRAGGGGAPRGGSGAGGGGAPRSGGGGAGGGHGGGRGK